MGEHRIARQIIEVLAGDRGSAAALADRAASAAPMIAATLERRFDAVEDGRRRRIERLVLTLDPCNRADFEASLLANLDAALARALPEQLARAAVIDPVEDALDLIAGFLRKAVLPWWSGTDALVVAEAAETLIAAEDSRGAPGRAALRHLLLEADTATRLVRALPAPLLPRLAAWLADLGAEELETLAVLLTAEQRDPDPGAAAIFVWSSILVAAARQAARPTPREFASETRACLARLEGRSEIGHLQAAPLAPASYPPAPPTARDESRPSPRGAEASDEPGPGRDRALAPEDARPTHDRRDSPEPEDARSTDGRRNSPEREDDPATDEGEGSAADPESHPASGQLSDTGSPDIGPPVSRPSEARKQFDQGGDAIPASQVTVPTDEGRNLPLDDGRSLPPDPEPGPASRRLADAPPPDIDPPLFVVKPAPAEPPNRRPERATAASDAREPRAVPPTPDGGRAGRPRPGDVESAPRRDEAGRPTASLGPNEKTGPPIAASSASEHDSLYIETAGIILLGPFLSDYFAAAGLIDSECRFKTQAARHRAVALIDHLATGDPDPPESRLALAKLLAGMPIDTVLMTRPLDQAETAAAEALLVAALAELPMLGRLTVDGFRSAWLNRPGILTVAHGSWLLRIERRSWDVLLDRLEWPIHWLELPWQPEGIRIEW